MGGSLYNSDSRSLRAKKLNYATAPVEETFKQQRLRRIHESMDPKGVTVRESCDSTVHPATVPFQLYMDVTASMGGIPVYLVKEGLPHLMSEVIQKGVKDAALMFGAVGDHECDTYPLQVGQFESGDEELDMWLTRTFLEKGGGGNEGESYLLAWYFAANHTKTDAFDKRGHKSCLFTTGDEACLTSLPISAVKEIMGGNIGVHGNYTDKELLTKAQEKYDVYHLHMMHSRTAEESLPYWEKLLGEKCIKVIDYTQTSHVIADIVVKNYERFLKSSSSIPTPTPSEAKKPETGAPDKEQEIML